MPHIYIFARDYTNMGDLGVTPLHGSEFDTQQLFTGADIDISLVMTMKYHWRFFNSDEFVASTPPNVNHTEDSHVHINTDVYIISGIFSDVSCVISDIGH